MLAHLAISPLWHIEVHAKKMPAIDVAFFGDHMSKAASAEKALRSKAEIVRALTDKGEEFATFLDGLDEAALAQHIELPNGAKSRFEMVLGAKEHEMHHRGQLMLVQRLIGQVPELTRRRQARFAQTANR